MAGLGAAACSDSGATTGVTPNGAVRARLSRHNLDHLVLQLSLAEQRFVAHGGMHACSHVLRQKQFRQQLRKVLPRNPINPSAERREGHAVPGL